MSICRRSVHRCAAALGVLTLVACSSSAALSGESVIEGELADAAGLGELDAQCNEPDGLEEGETFTCTAVAEDGRTVEFLGTMTSNDSFDIVSTNLLTSEDVVAIREEGARLLSQDVGVEIRSADIVCPDAIVVLDDTGDFVCEITERSTGDVYELTISTGGIEPGEGVRSLSFRISDEPI